MHDKDKSLLLILWKLWTLVKMYSWTLDSLLLPFNIYFSITKFMVKIWRITLWNSWSLPESEVQTTGAATKTIPVLWKCIKSWKIFFSTLLYILDIKLNAWYVMTYFETLRPHFEIQYCFQVTWVTWATYCRHI